MKARLSVIVAAALAACSGCVISTEDTEAGEPQDASFTLTWTIVDARTDSEIDCQLAGADNVRVRARNISTGEVVIDLFDCDAGAGRTFALSAGNYSVSVALVDCRGDATCRRADVLSSLPIPGVYGVWDDGLCDLGHFEFQVD